jgi:hypothetical protein
MLSLLALDHWRPMTSPAASQTAYLGVGLIVVLTLILGFRNGQYTSTRRLSRIRDAGKLLTFVGIATSVVALALVVTKGFFIGSMEFSRLLTAASLVIFLFVGAAGRVILATRQRALFMSGAAFCKCLVLGGGKAAHEFVTFVNKRPWLGVACVGHLEYYSPEETDGSWPAGPTAYSIGPTYEGFDNLDRIWCASGASEVVVALVLSPLSSRRATGPRNCWAMGNSRWSTLMSTPSTLSRVCSSGRWTSPFRASCFCVAVSLDF